MRSFKRLLRCRRALSSLQRPLSQPTSFTHSHLLTPAEITPGITREQYLSRRAALGESLPENSVTLFPSNPAVYMSEDVPYLYHHNTDLMYIAGITEPGALLLADKSGGDVRYTLFVSPRNETKELWEGPLCGAGEEVRQYFGVDDVLDTSQLAGYISGTLEGMQSFHFDGRINPSLTQMLRSLGRGEQTVLMEKWSQQPPKQFLQELRLVKSDEEITLLRRAASIVAQSLNDTIAKCGKDVEESFIEANLEYGCKIRGATRMAFPCVVASGRNGTVLHYMANNSTARHGDLVMVDAGCEVHGYCSDVSRTWPIGGMCTPQQRELYSLVLDVQKDVIGHVKPGISLDDLHIHGVRLITQGLLDLAFLPGESLQSSLEKGAYARYFPHAVGHYLGMDVHDTHGVSKSRKLEAGMIVTVEPGVYCREDVPHGFEKVGIRVEDDVLVTDSGGEVLSREGVKEIADMESLVRG